MAVVEIFFWGGGEFSSFLPLLGHPVSGDWSRGVTAIRGRLQRNVVRMGLCLRAPTVFLFAFYPSSNGILAYCGRLSCPNKYGPSLGLYLPAPHLVLLWESTQS